jgi:Holliday junction DNA helicase RuvA
MISRLRGRLLERQPTRLVVDVGGVGYEVLVPVPTSQGAGEPGSEISLHTVMVVREDSLTLYGFRRPEERSLFLKLIGVSGIGPKTALGALSGPSVEELAAAIRDGDLGLLTRLPGIGKKTAERLSLELKDALVEVGGKGGKGTPAGARNDAASALVSLGYGRTAALAAVEAAAGELGGEPGTEALVRRALSRLGGRGSDR